MVLFNVIMEVLRSADLLTVVELEGHQRGEHPALILKI